jgi:hypothetical protein
MMMIDLFDDNDYDDIDDDDDDDDLFYKDNLIRMMNIFILAL